MCHESFILQTRVNIGTKYGQQVSSLNTVGPTFAQAVRTGEPFTLKRLYLFNNYIYSVLLESELVSLLDY